MTLVCAKKALTLEKKTQKALQPIKRKQATEKKKRIPAGSQWSVLIRHRLFV